jgi:hypothetical protein
MGLVLLLVTLLVVRQKGFWTLQGCKRALKESEKFVFLSKHVPRKKTRDCTMQYGFGRAAEVRSHRGKKN